MNFEIDSLNKEIDFNDLDYIYKMSDRIIKFYDFSHDQMKNGEITMREFSKNGQKRFEARLKPLEGGIKTEEQKKTLDNIAKFYDGQKYVIDLFDDFTTIAPEARYQAVKETKRQGIKMPAP